MKTTEYNLNYLSKWRRIDMPNVGFESDLLGYHEYVKIGRQSISSDVYRYSVIMHRRIFLKHSSCPQIFSS